MVEAVFFLSLVLVAVVQMIKMALPTVQSWLTIVVAVGLGIALAFIDVHIGVTDITIAQGIVIALGAVGISVAAEKAGGA